MGGTGIEPAYIPAGTVTGEEWWITSPNRRQNAVETPVTESTATTLVLGIGNILLSDEGAGVHVVRYLEQRHPRLPHVTWLDGGTLSFTLAVPIEDANNLIVVDAAQLESAPGTVRCFAGEEMDRFLGTRRHSVHEVNMADLLDIGRLTGTLPRNRALVGIQFDSLAWGDAPSDAVAEAIPRAAGQVLTLIRAWTDSSGEAPGD